MPEFGLRSPEIREFDVSPDPGNDPGKTALRRLKAAKYPGR